MTERKDPLAAQKARAEAVRTCEHVWETTRTKGGAIRYRCPKCRTIRDVKP
jgi:hypothetical protein